MSSETTNLHLVKQVDNEYLDWDEINSNLDKIDAAVGGVAEEVLGKETPLGAQAKADEAAAASIPKSLATAANDMLFASGVGAWVKKTLAEAKTLLGITMTDIATLLGDSFFKQSNYGAVTTHASDVNLVLSHQNKVVTMTDSAIQTINIPLNSSIQFPIGTAITFIQRGAGEVQFAPAGGVTLESKDTKRKIDGRYTSATLIKVATDTWSLIGSLKA